MTDYQDNVEIERAARRQVLLERIALEEVDGELMGTYAAIAVRPQGDRRSDWLPRFLVALAGQAPLRAPVAGQPTWRSGAPGERRLTPPWADL
jgi:hypothetical protein